MLYWKIYNCLFKDMRIISVLHKKTLGNSSHCSGLDGQSYVVSVVYGRWKVTHGFSQGAQKLTPTSRLSKKQSYIWLLLVLVIKTPMIGVLYNVQHIVEIGISQKYSREYSRKHERVVSENEERQMCATTVHSQWVIYYFL